MSEDFKKWLKRQAEDSGAKIMDSEFFAGIIDDNFIKDPLCALQIGYAVLLGKPIVLMVDESVKVSATLEKAAQGIIRVDMKNPASMQRGQEDLAKWLKGNVQ